MKSRSVLTTAANPAPPDPIEDVRIGRSREIVIAYGLKSGNNVGQLPNQLWGEILVQQDAHGLAVAVGHIGHLCRKRVDRREVLFLEAGMFVENLFLSHTVREPAENVIYRDPHAANARLAVPFAGLDRDARMRGRHNSIIAQNSTGRSPLANSHFLGRKTQRPKSTPDQLPLAVTEGSIGIFSIATR
jgi:hypothetical protein